MKISLNISDDLRHQAEHKAISMGLNLSGYIRTVVSEDIKKFREKIDAIAIEAKQDDSELTSFDSFIEELDGYIANAKD